MCAVRSVRVCPAKKASKFRDWLDCSTLELKPNSMAMEILSYLAYETVAQVCHFTVLRRSQCRYEMRFKAPRRPKIQPQLLSVIIFPPLDCGFISIGQAGNDSEDKSHQSRCVRQLHPVQHSHRGERTHTHSCSLLTSRRTTVIIFEISK